MSRMIRKQVYIEERQERALKRRARELGVTEAELVRRSLDGLAPPAPLARKERALKEMLRYIRRHRRMKVPQTGRKWTREELYEERLARFSR